VDDWISVRELARHYELITNKGRSWVIGDPDSPIITYSSKPEALAELVETPNYQVLTKLRELVRQKIREDKGGFTTVLTDAERYLTGETDEVSAGASPAAALTKFNFDDDVTL
jgi:hypothetical protein